MLSLIFLALVFFLIAVRRVGFIRFRIWQVMLLGAACVLVTGQISPVRAIRSVNLDVILFLFGVFIVGRALEESGYLAFLTSRLFRRAGNPDALLLSIFFGMGLLSALLMNDTLAIVGTPVVLALAARSHLPPRAFLLSLAFAVTIGSVASPIGNPQNLLIALHGDILNPFVTFGRYLLLPTLFNLLLAYGVVRLYYGRHFSGQAIDYQDSPVTDVRLAGLVKVSLLLLIALITVKVASVFAGWNLDIRLTYVVLAAALPVILFSRKRLRIVREIDWSTLTFFAAMFILMESVWDSGYLQKLFFSAGGNSVSNGQIIGVSVLLSQLISNVPLVALYLPVLGGQGGVVGLMALAAGSTIAGNLTILGAASNVIIIQNAEKSGTTLTFWDFIRIGAPLTAINAAVYWLWFSLVG